MILGISFADIEVFVKGLGIAAGVISIIKILYELNNIYNHLVTTDKLVKSQIDKLNEKITKVEEDLRDTRFESREARARIMDRLLEVERRAFKINWERYVQAGILSREQLNQIRNKEKGQ